MYLLGKEIWKDKGSGFLCAVIFTFFPYRLGLVYIRGDFAEFLATALIPLVLFAFLKLGQKRRLGYFLLSSFSLALIFLAHNIQVVLFLPILLIYLLVVFRKEIKKVILPIFLAGITGLGIASFFVFPALLEEKYLAVSTMYTGQYDFHEHFLKIADFLSLKWDNDHFFQIGIIGIVILCFVIYVLSKKIVGLPRKNIYFFLILMVGSIAACFSISTFFWESTPFFKFVQYPWRVLSFVALALSILGGMIFRTKIVHLFFKEKIPKFVPAIALALIVVFANLFFAQPVSYLEKESDEAYNPYRQLYSEANLETTYRKENEQLIQSEKLNIYTLIPEFVPKGTNVELLKNQIAGTISDQLKKKEEFRILKIEALRGRIEWKEQQINSYNYSFEINSEQESSIRVNNFWFPGWQAFLDGEEQSIEHDNDFQAMVFDLPPGNHVLQLKFSSTPIRRIGGVITIITLGIWLVLLIIYFLRTVVLKNNDKSSPKIR